jgi:hypothetical protein
MGSQRISVPADVGRPVAPVSPSYGCVSHNRSQFFATKCHGFANRAFVTAGWRRSAAGRQGASGLLLAGEHVPKELGQVGDDAVDAEADQLGQVFAGVVGADVAVEGVGGGPRGLAEVVEPLH